jgi:hypothetical protein
LAVLPEQDPRYPDKSHFEPLIAKKVGKGGKRCQAWKTDRSGQCSHSAAKGLSVCKYHGASGVQARKDLKNRRDFLEALSKASDEPTQKSINEMAIGQLAAKVIGGDFQAIRYWLDQQFGGPTATVVTEIVDRDLLERVIKVQAAFYKDNQSEFERWLAFFQESLRESNSTTLEGSPEE